MGIEGCSGGWGRGRGGEWVGEAHTRTGVWVDFGWHVVQPSPSDSNEAWVGVLVGLVSTSRAPQ